MKRSVKQSRKCYQLVFLIQIYVTRAAMHEKDSRWNLMYNHDYVPRANNFLNPRKITDSTIYAISQPYNNFLSVPWLNIICSREAFVGEVWVIESTFVIRGGAASCCRGRSTPTTFAGSFVAVVHCGGTLIKLQEEFGWRRHFVLSPRPMGDAGKDKS